MSKDHPMQVAINSIKRNKFTVQDWPHYKPIPEMEDVKEYKAAVEKQHRMAWSWYNRHFSPINTTAHGLAVQVWKGNAFTPIYKNNWRRKVNFLTAHHIAFDFDTGDGRSSLDHIEHDWIYQEYGAFLYSTPSSTAEHPKSRMVFVFDKPITEIDRYELLYKALLNLRFPYADQLVKDAARLFFGSYKCEVRGNWQLLTEDGQNDLVDAYNQAMAHEAASRPAIATMTIPPEHASGRFGKILAKLLDNIRTAPAGQRHRTVVTNSFAVGGYVAGGYIGKGEAEAAVVNAVAGMHQDADKMDLERTAVESLTAGMSQPLTISRTLDYIEDEP